MIERVFTHYNVNTLMQQTLDELYGCFRKLGNLLGRIIYLIYIYLHLEFK